MLSHFFFIEKKNYTIVLIKVKAIILFKELKGLAQLFKNLKGLFNFAGIVSDFEASGRYDSDSDSGHTPPDHHLLLEVPELLKIRQDLDEEIGQVEEGLYENWTPEAARGKDIISPLLSDGFLYVMCWI